MHFTCQAFLKPERQIAALEIIASTASTTVQSVLNVHSLNEYSTPGKSQKSQRPNLDYIEDGI